MSLKRVPLPVVEGDLPILISPNIVYSVVNPLYNDAETLPVLHQRVSAVMQELAQPYEIVYVDDGSQDVAGEIHWWGDESRIDS